MLSHKTIVATIIQHLESEFTACDIQYPGELLDVQGLTEWAELEIVANNRPKARNTGKDIRKLTITVGIYVKPGWNIYRHMQIQTDVVNALEHAVLSLSGGYLKVYEANTAVTTRSRNELPTGTRTAAVAFQAQAQEI
jgi:hypothetical protein